MYLPSGLKSCIIPTTTDKHVLKSLFIPTTDKPAQHNISLPPPSLSPSLPSLSLSPPPSLPHLSDLTYIVSRENDLHLLPGWVRGEFLVDEVLEVLMQPGHEVGTWCDAVGVKPRL